MLSIYITIPFLLIPQILLAGAILDYDKIHHSLTSKRYVPIYADVNLSRWSFEALAVLQFAHNRYDKDLLDQFILKSKLTFHANFLIPKLQTELDRFEREKEEGDAKEVELLIKELASQYPEIRTKLNDIKVQRDNTLEISKTIKQIKKWLRNNIKEVNKKIDNYRKDMNPDISKLEYRNIKLSNMVLKSDLYHKYVYNNGIMIRKFQPGYFEAESKIGRAHYYAPYKFIGNLKITTWKFNAGVIVLIGLMFFILTLLHLIKK